MAKNGRFRVPISKHLELHGLLRAAAGQQDRAGIRALGSRAANVGQLPPALGLVANTFVRRKVLPAGNGLPSLWRR